MWIIRPVNSEYNKHILSSKNKYDNNNNNMKTNIKIRYMIQVEVPAMTTVTVQSAKGTAHFCVRFVIRSFLTLIDEKEEWTQCCVCLH